MIHRACSTNIDVRRSNNEPQAFSYSNLSQQRGVRPNKGWHHQASAPVLGLSESTSVCAKPFES